MKNKFPSADARPTTPKKFILPDVSAYGVLLAHSKKLLAYFRAHRALARVLPRICAHARLEFGHETELALDLYHDPETGDEYPTLYVRPKKYRPSLMDKIEKVSDTIRPLFEKSSGFFLLTTDFRKPGL